MRQYVYIEISEVNFLNFWLLVAKILHVWPEIQNLRKESAPEPDSELQILKSKAKNAKTERLSKG